MIRPFLLLPIVFASCWAEQIPALDCIVRKTEPPTVRSEGLTELIGDIVLNCTGGTLTPLNMPVPTANITVSLNCPVTSQFLSGGSNATSETLLLLEEPPPDSQLLAQPGQVVLGTGSGQGTYNGTPGHPNVFLGISAGNSVTFERFPIDAPDGKSRVFRMTNIRVNPSGLEPGSPVTATTRLDYGGSLIPVVNATQVVAFVRTGLSFSVRNQTSRDDNNWVTGTPVPVGTLQFETLYAPSVLRQRFDRDLDSLQEKLQNIPGKVYNSESGFYNPALSPTAGLAESGTRLKAALSNLPSGTSIFVSVNNLNPTPSSNAALTSSETGPFKAIRPTVTLPGGVMGAELPVVNGTASAVWEILNNNPTNAENFGFGVWFAHPACSTRADCPRVGTSTVTGSFASLSTLVNRNLKAQTVPEPLPRFCTGCGSGLQFPLASTQPPFESGIAISNYGDYPLVTITSSAGNPAVFEFGPPFNQNPVPTLRFLSARSGEVPFPVNVQVLSSNGRIDNFSFTLAAQNTPNAVTLPPSTVSAFKLGTTSREATSAWLTVAANTTSTPAALTISVHPAGLAPGNYDGRITLAASSIANSGLSVPVRLTVTPDGPYFTANGLVNAATYFPGVVAPGEAVTVFGSRFGPSTLAALALTPQGSVSTSIGQTRLLFDDVAAPMIYAVNGQISAFVPYSVAGKPTTQVQVEYNGVKSSTVTIPVLDAVPGFFTIDQSGSGQAAVLNQDGSVNGRLNPAKPGDVVQIFGTGAGQTTPASRDGTITAAPPSQNLPVNAVIGGKQADVIFYGPAPSAVAGVLQLNVRIPANVTPADNVPVRAQIGDKVSQPGLTIAVR